MVKVVYYARVSTEEEEQLNALQGQIIELESFIVDKADWVLVDSYVDEGKSGTSTKGRVEYNRLYDEMDTDKFDIVVIKDQSRLMRKTMDWYLFIDKLIKNGKKLFIYLDNAFYTSKDFMKSGFMAMVAEDYSMQLSKKTNSTNKRKHKEGVIFGNGRIWGYDKVGKELVINEEQAKVVRTVYDLYIQGKGFREINKVLHAQGIQSTNGTPFAMTTLKRMIRNEKYKGLLMSNKRHFDFETKEIANTPEGERIKHEGRIPAIVSAEVWEKANEILESKRREYDIDDKAKIAGYFSGSYVYSTKVKCGKCGRPYWHQKYASMINEVWQCSGYRQFGKTHELGCNNVSLQKPELDSIVKEVIYEFWQEKDKNIENVISILSKVISESDNYEDLEALIKERGKVQNRIDNLIDLRADGEVSKEEFNRKKQFYLEQFEKIEGQIKDKEGQFKDAKTKIERLEQVRKALNVTVESKDSLTDEIIKNFLKGIVVHEDGTLDITLYGDFRFIANRVENKYEYQIVSANGSN
jgi:DNA invertase Pin-like site-specific DNA recombinase